VTTLQTNEFGRDHIRYTKPDQRFRMGLTRTLRPVAGETNERFEARMHQMVCCLYECDPPPEHVDLDFERRAGALVECTVKVFHTPVAAPIADTDGGPAGGRNAKPRGGRGGGHA